MQPRGPDPPPVGLLPSREDFDVIVIGSGVGGSVSAALLAHAGLRVLVVEKNPALGGILAAVQHDGAKLDLGSHLISRGARGPLGRTLRALDLEEPEFITHRIPVRSRGVFDQAAPTHKGGLLKVAWETANKLGLDGVERARIGRMLFHVMTLTERELVALDRVTLSEFVRRYTENAQAYFLFSFLASIFFVLPPWEVSAGEAIRSLRWIIRDWSLSYVRGGMDGICHALLGKVVEGGGEIVVRQRVSEVRRVGDRFVVETATGARFVAKRIVANVAPNEALRLLQASEWPRSYHERIARIVPSGSAHQLKLILKRPLIEEGCLIGGISLEGLTLGDLSFDLMERMVHDIRSGAGADPIAVYAPVPTNYDETLSEHGEQIVVASIYGATSPQHSVSLDSLRDRSIAALASVVPGLEQEIVLAEFRPIGAIGSWMGRTNNAAISTGQTPGQVGADRLSVVTPIPGFFLAGDGAGGRGIGTELATASGHQAASAVLEEVRREH